MALTDLAAFIRNPLGTLLDGRDQRQWRFRSLDPEVELDLVGDFEPRAGVRTVVSTRTTTAQSLGDQGELVQFLSGRSDRVSVTVELHSHRRTDSLEERLRQLEGLARRHPVLLRSPRLRFSWGNEYSRDVVVTDVTHQIVRLHPAGEMAEIHVDISMIESVDAALVVTEAGKPPPESVEVVLSAGETCELVAQRYYQDPMLGVALRLRHPDLVGGVEQSGARILVVARGHPDLKGAARFVSPALVAGDDLDEAFADLLDARSAPRTVPDA